MSSEPHKHVYNIPASVKSRLSKHENIDGRNFDSDSGYDIIKGFKCTCGAFQASDLERHTA